MGNLSDIASGTLIGFSGNKTVTDAKRDTATNRVDICKTKELYFNGERLGLTDTEANYLSKKLTEEYNARLSVVASVNKSVVEKGAQTDVTLTVTTKFDGAVVAPSSISVKIGTTTVAMTKQSNNTYFGTVKCSDTTSFSVSVTYNGVTKTAVVNVAAYYKYYVGQTTADTVTSLPSSGFTAKGPQSSAAGTYNFTFAAAEYAYILLPVGNVNRGKLTTAGADGLYHAVEGVSDVPFIKQSTQAIINGVSYDVFRLANAQIASSHTITI